MSERKVLNKYYPPDFDPSIIPRRRGPKNSQQVVRLMAPFSMRCNTCGEYIYKGKKFNARKETVQGEDYYGIKIFRFYIKCTLCSAEITFKTDPKNTDYQAELGASRNFEPWREEKAVEEEDRLAKLEEEENNPMKALENRTVDSKREMDVLDALQDIRARNARNERMGRSGDVSELLQPSEPLTEEEIARLKAEDEDEELVRQVFSWVDGPSTSSLQQAEGDSDDGKKPIIVKRKAELLDDEPESKPSTLSSITRLAPQNQITKKRKSELAKSLGIKVGKGKAPAKVGILA